MISLKGKRILVTREARGAERFADKITAYDGTPIITPLLAVNCLRPSEEAISLIEGNVFDWVFFTSKNGVDCFLQTDSFKWLLTHTRIAAVGPKTAQAIERHGFHVDFVPSVYNAETMAAEFLSKGSVTGRVLLVRGTLASPVLPEAFRRRGQKFTSIEVYETVTSTGIKDELNEVLSQERVDALTFTSPSAIDAFMELADDPEEFFTLPTACIGTTTEKHAKRKGFVKTIVPEQFTIEGMIEAMCEHLRRKDETNGRV